MVAHSNWLGFVRVGDAIRTVVWSLPSAPHPTFNSCTFRLAWFRARRGCDLHFRVVSPLGADMTLDRPLVCTFRPALVPCASDASAAFGAFVGDAITAPAASLTPLRDMALVCSVIPHGEGRSDVES